MPSCKYVPIDSTLVLVDSRLVTSHTSTQSSSPFVSSSHASTSIFPSMSYKLQGSTLVPVSFSMVGQSSCNIHPMQARSKTHSLQDLLSSIDSYDDLVHNEPKSIH